MTYSYERRGSHNPDHLIPRLRSLVRDEMIKDIVYEYATDPFLKQRQLAIKFGLSLERLKSINSDLKQNAALRELIINQGSASAYYNNTVIPLKDSKHFRSVIADEYAYPRYVALHVGFNCMFRCHFCPRNHDVRYLNDLARQSLDMVKELFDQAPKDIPQWHTRFKISGGHEPLTNPYVSDMVAYGASKGYRLKLYTNGFMLTDNFLKKKKGLMDLEAIRISLYGTDDASYESNTLTKGSWEVVNGNIRSCLDHISQSGSNTMLGLNFIILPGQAHKVKDVINLVRDLNNHGNGIKFLTLREDYSPGQIDLIEREKLLLVETFDWIKREQQLGNLGDTHIDYGYALNPLACGHLNFGPIRKAQPHMFDAAGHPQLGVQVDPSGIVNVFHAGYQDKQGADKFHIGNILIDGTMEEVVKKHLSSGYRFTFSEHDHEFMDSFDHAANLLLDQVKDDIQFGINLDERFI